MNTHDKIELPTEFRSGNSIPVERATITRERMTEILQDAIEAYRKRRVVPLTDERIRLIWKETKARMGVGGDPVLWFARAIERAHGISAPQSAEPSKNGPRKGDQRIIDGVVWTCTDPEIDRWVTTGSQPAEPIVSDVEAIVRLLESREWAEHVATTPLGQRLETAITVLMGADPQPAEPVSQHPDDVAVDAFATAMKAKLKRAREEKGRGGWQDMSATVLSDMLREHVQKGDPVDVANLAMMLHQNGQGIAPAEPVKYWLCCGSTDPTHADRKQPDCYDPDKAKFGTAESHKDSPAEPQECGCCGRSDGCDPDCDAAQPAEPCVSSVIDKTACESENGGREPQPAEPVKHDLYKTGDEGAPEKILDRNGEVVLDCCKRCGKAEIELSEQCVAEPVKQSLPALHFLPLSELRELAMRDCGKYSDDDLAIAWELFDRLVEGGRITDAPEPVKRKRRYAQGTALGEFGVIPMCDQVDDEPVKVPSDEEVLRIAIDSDLASRDSTGEVVCAWREDADISQYLIENARALLSRYGVPSGLPYALRDLVALWREQQSEYPAGGKQAAAAVRLCANELESLLDRYTN